ncbi:hypothetical protein [Streptomyces sp. NPDC059788]|uniref:hypothetical protein n=1 Tax=Streptomyces sp. NPDC059788 TaxID=3346948 RepID=UPI0036475324
MAAHTADGAGSAETEQLTRLTDLPSPKWKTSSTTSSSPAPWKSGTATAMAKAGGGNYPFAPPDPAVPDSLTEHRIFYMQAVPRNV